MVRASFEVDGRLHRSALPLLAGSMYPVLDSLVNVLTRLSFIRVLPLLPKKRSEKLAQGFSCKVLCQPLNSCYAALSVSHR
jgi:hypothetical protein